MVEVIYLGSMKAYDIVPHGSHASVLGKYGLQETTMVDKQL